MDYIAGKYPDLVPLYDEIYNKHNRSYFEACLLYTSRCVSETAREPDDYTLTDDKVEIITQPETDLWQRTYYHFRNDNAPVLQIETEEKFFSFMVKTDFKEKMCIRDSHYATGTCDQ